MPGSNEVMPEVMADLVVAAQGGDWSAFDELVRLTDADTYTLAFRLTADPDDAGDVVQESYLGPSVASSVSATPSSPPGSTGSPATARRPTWGAGPATATTSSTTTWPSTTCGPRPTRRRRSTRRCSETGCRSRSGRCRLRAVVVLRDAYDLPHDAIASELGISVSAAKVRLHRARRRLREQLYPMPGEPVVAPRCHRGRGQGGGRRTADRRRGR